jgi:p-cumate 2,3-dioxygenase beta subunit
MTAAIELDLSAGSDRVVDRNEVEEFFYDEAALLDDWKLDEWLTGFVPGATMLVPTTDAGGLGPGAAGYFVADDWDLLGARVKRLKSRKAHAENPHSRTTRLVSNVRIIGREGSTLHVGANFVIHRYRDGGSFHYVGRYEHELLVTNEGLKFTLRRATLTNEAMEPGARLSFIL